MTVLNYRKHKIPYILHTVYKMYFSCTFFSALIPLENSHKFCIGILCYCLGGFPLLRTHILQMRMPKHKRFSHLKFSNTHSLSACVCMCVSMPQKDFHAQHLSCCRFVPAVGDTHFELDLAATETVTETRCCSAVGQLVALAASIIFCAIGSCKGICQILVSARPICAAWFELLASAMCKSF